MAKLRKMTGICLQHDLHFAALTVEEHLEFYGKLRVNTDQLTYKLLIILMHLDEILVSMSLEL